MQIPVPTAPVAPAPQMQAAPAPQQNVAPVVAQDDFFDKMLKGLVAFIANLVNKPAAGQTAPNAPIGMTPGGVPTAPVQQIPTAPVQQIPTAPVQQVPVAPAPQMIQGMATAPEVSAAPANLLGNIGSTIGTVANQAVTVAQTGVSTVVQNAENYIAEPVPTTPAVDVQNFLAQNYQTTAVPPVAQAPVVTAPEQTIPTAVPSEPIAPQQAISQQVPPMTQ